MVISSKITMRLSLLKKSTWSFIGPDLLTSNSEARDTLPVFRAPATFRDDILETDKVALKKVTSADGFSTLKTAFCPGGLQNAFSLGFGQTFRIGVLINAGIFFAIGYVGAVRSV